MSAVRCAIVAFNRRNLIKQQQTQHNELMYIFREASSTPYQIDRSKVPKLDEAELEENFISGSGPGGQSVNKSVNCCQLKHKSTGIVVKVHQTRSLEENRKLARQLMIEKLDEHFNGEDSVLNQKKRIALDRIVIKQTEQEKLRAMKKAHKEFLEKKKNRIRFLPGDDGGFL